MSRFPRSLSILLALVALCWSANVSATIVTYADVAELTKLSDRIVEGRIVDQNTYFDDAYGAVVTDTTVEVKRTFMGKATKTVKFQQWGGNLNGEMRKVPGDAEFDPYEDVILFLVEGKGKNAGHNFLTSLSQSKFGINEADDKKVVYRDLGKLAFKARGQNDIKHRENEIWHYAKFVETLKQIVATKVGGKK